MRRYLGPLLLSLTTALLLIAPSAGARTFETHSFSTSFDGHDAIGAPAFQAESLEKIAIDEATGTVYVGGRFDVYKFNSSGVSLPFSSVAPETVIKDGISESEYTVGDLAVDNSGGPNQSRFYGFAAEKDLNLYEPSGSPFAGAGFPVPNTSRGCGLAFEPDGDFWLRSNNGAALEYHADGTPTGAEVSFEGFNFSCGIAVYGGYFFIPSNSGGLINKYDSSGKIVQRIDGSGTAKNVAIDSSNGEIYVDVQTAINHYSAAGEFLESFGALHESRSLAVDSTTHAVYALDYGPPATVQKFNPSGTTLTVPDATTEPVTEVTRVGATVHGKLVPAGSPITECAFEYGLEYGGFAESVPCAEGNSFGAETAVSAVIANGTPDTEYQYRLRVANGDGSGYGKIGTFRTPLAIKDLTTEAATGVDHSHATLHGSFDPDGLETEYWFDYWTDNFSHEFQTLHKTTSSSGTFDVSAALSELEAGTGANGAEIYFRLTAENDAGRTYGEILGFRLPPAVTGVATGIADELSLTSATFHGSFEPEGVETHYYIEYGSTASYGGYTPASPPGQVSSATGVEEVSGHVTGLPRGIVVHYRMVAVNATGKTVGSDATVLLGEGPEISDDLATEVNTDTTVLEAKINPDNRATTYHWEYGLEDCAISTCLQSEPKSIPSGLAEIPIHINVEGLTPGTTYHFRLIASNELGEDIGEDHSFVTYVQESGADDCQNVLERKQTGAAATKHCRAYELVSAADTGGYDVESNLISGLTPMPGFPSADGKVLYTVRFGSIPGSGNPTNKGGDPYLAIRGATGWTTEYVGFQANGTPSTAPFASTLLEAAQGLGALAFGGPELCSPCFADGSRNTPLRLGSGPIGKGMAGTFDPVAEPAGYVAKAFSADGTHFVFGSTSRFEPAGNEGSLSIYERQLGGTGGGTEVVSTMPDGSTMPGPGTAELDIAEDGSRVLIGREVGTDAGGNRLYDLYMHLAGRADSVEVVNTVGGVLYSGMSADGSTVYFTTAAKLAGDTDGSDDLFRADVGSSGSAITRVSTGAGGAGASDACNPAAGADGNHWNLPGAASAATCGVVAIGGGGGVASAGATVYFLSPEQLDGPDGVAGQPNLYVAETGGEPKFVATLDADNPVVRDSVSDAAERETADFQTTPDGRFAVFGNDTVLTENETNGRGEIYRSEVGGELTCVSCIPSNIVPTSDTRLTSRGLNLVEGGRVFFTTSEQLVLRDTNQLKDAYEWEDGHVALISTGLDSNDSGLLTASTNGMDVLFFTRQTLAPQDENGGSMKIYDAREGGGFLYNPPPRPCVASDECHGPGTQQASPPAINTIGGNGRKQKSANRGKSKHCRSGTVKRHGKCVKAPKGKKKSHKKRSPRGKERHHG